MEDIVLEYKINTSINDIWNSWTKEDELTKWFAPKANIDPKNGGTFELFFDPKNKQENSTIGCTFLNFEPMRKLRFNWKGPAPMSELMNNADNLTEVLIEFEAIEDKVNLKLTHYGWREGKDWEKARKWHVAAWRMSIEDLIEYLEDL